MHYIGFGASSVTSQPTSNNLFVSDSSFANVFGQTSTGKNCYYLANFWRDSNKIQKSNLTTYGLIEFLPLPTTIIIVKLCVHFDLWSLKKWTQTDAKVTFHLPIATTTPHYQETFLVSNERYGRNDTFAMALILPRLNVKWYHPFYSLWL